MQSVKWTDIETDLVQAKVASMLHWHGPLSRLFQFAPGQVRMKGTFNTKRVGKRYGLASMLTSVAR